MQVVDAVDLDAQKRLTELHHRLKTWEAVGAQLGLNKGLVYQVATGQRHSPKVREVLGLPVYVEVAPCPCGRVHVRGTCRAGQRVLQRQASSDPDFLRFIQETVIPFLQAKGASHDR